MFGSDGEDPFLKSCLINRRSITHQYFHTIIIWWYIYAMKQNLKNRTSNDYLDNLIKSEYLYIIMNKYCPNNYSPSLQENRQGPTLYPRSDSIHPHRVSRWFSFWYSKGGVSCNEAFDQCRAPFNCSEYEDTINVKVLEDQEWGGKPAEESDIEWE